MFISPNSSAGFSRRLVYFSIPIFFSNFLQIFYALVDMAVVGHFVGSAGLASIANGSIFAYIACSIGTGLALGGAVLVGRYKGAGSESGQKESISSLMVLSLLAGAMVSPLCLFYAEPLFILLNVDQTVLPQAVSYVSIINAGLVLFYLGTAISFVLRGMGDSRSPLYFMLVGGLINIILDLILVGGFSFGVKGAALATVAAQAGSLVFSLFYLKRNGIHEISLSGVRPNFVKIKAILRISLPSMIQLLVVNLSYLTITGLLNGFGVSVAAAAGIGIKICTLAVMPCWAIGQALTAMVSISLGAGKGDDAEIYGKTAVRLNLMVTALIVLGVQVFAEPLIKCFNPLDQSVINDGIFYLRICCSLGCVLYAVMYTFNCLATGAGAASFAMFNSLLDSILIRFVLIGWLYWAGYGLPAIYLGQALSALLPAAVGSAYFHRRKWKVRKLI